MDDADHKGAVCHEHRDTAERVCVSIGPEEIGNTVGA